MKRTCSFLFVIILAGLCAVRASVVADDDDVARLLQTFADQPTLANAEEFFGFLQNEEFVDEPIVPAKDADKERLQADVWYWAAEWYYAQQDYNLAEKYGRQALPLCHKSEDKTMEADCASLLGLIYVRKGDFKQAAIYATQCNELDLKSGDADNIASSYNTLAGIYMSARQPREAEKYILQAIEYAEKTDNYSRQAVIYGMASEVYQKLQDPEQSLLYATRALEIEEQLGRQDKVAVRQTQRSASLIALRRYDEAKYALDMAIPILRETGNIHSLGIACIQRGDLLRKEKNDSDAIPYYEEAVEIFTRQHDLFNLSHAYDGLRNAYRKINPKQALLYDDMFISLRDSLYDSETSNTLSRYAAEYDNYALREENAAMHSRNKKIIISIVSAFSLLLLLTCTIVVLYNRCQRKRFATLMKEVEDVRRAMIASTTVSQLKAKEKPKPDALTLEQPEEDDLLRRMVEEVNKSLAAHDVNVETIARNLAMSGRTLRRRITELTGGTPKEFICAIQMDKARSLLLAKENMPVADIAWQCGFDEPSSFTHTFQRLFNMSPKAFREQNKTAVS